MTSKLCYAVAAFAATLILYCDRSEAAALPTITAEAITADAVDVSPDSAGTTAAPQFGEPIPGLNASQTALFLDGQDTFNEVEEVADGLGPVFNGNSCGQCHAAPAIGGSRNNSDGSSTLETRFGKVTNGVFDPLESLGGSLIQTTGIGLQTGFNFVGEVVPASANRIAGRRTTALFGLGLVDAVSDNTYRLIAAAQQFDPDGVRGRVSIVHSPSKNANVVGKFGWKNQVGSLTDFAGDAYINEMGITNPLFPNENCPQGNCASLSHDPVPDVEDDGEDLAKFADFMTMLAPPPRGTITVQALIGEALFVVNRCSTCHVPLLITSNNNPIAALRNKVFSPFSDFLLHDMGALGDGIVQNTAGGKDMRTAPLWGVRDLRRFLHDGRATTLNEAILAHDGEARAAKTRYVNLSQTNKDYVIAFLKSL